MAKDYDPTIVSAKDSGMAQSNAINGASAVVVAELNAGIITTREEVDSRLAELMETFHTKNVTAFDHPRVGSGRPAPDPAVNAAEDALNKGGLSEDGGRPWATLTIKGKKAANRSLAQIEREDSGLLDWLASDKNNNEYTRTRAQEFKASA